MVVGFVEVLLGSHIFYLSMIVSFSLELMQ